jgi:hypothetical protein
MNCSDLRQEDGSLIAGCRLGGDGSMTFRLNHQFLYEETDLLLRYGRSSFELLHGH